MIIVRCVDMMSLFARMADFEHTRSHRAETAVVMGRSRDVQGPGKHMWKQIHNDSPITRDGHHE